MSVSELVPYLAKGDFFIFALIIGTIVSIDVVVVELTREYKTEKADGKEIIWNSRMRAMALMHASIHSLSFWFYTLAIFLVQFLPFIPIKLFNFPPDLSIGLLTLINFLLLVFVWWTYREKIKEYHSQKSDDSDVVERPDMKVFIDAIRMIFHKIHLGHKVRGIAVAGSVAVDMLAVSALLKAYLLPSNSAPPVTTCFTVKIAKLETQRQLPRVRPKNQTRL